MKVDILERNYKVKEKLNDLIMKKVSKMEKYLGKNASCKVVCSAAHDREKMEVTITADGLFVRSEVESDNMYANLDACLAKIEKQIVKHSDKLIDKKRNQLDLSDLMFFDELPVFKAPKITKRKDYELIPMTDNEAVEAMDLLGHSFYIYQDVKTGDVKVAYVRNDGDYGIITTHQ